MVNGLVIGGIVVIYPPLYENVVALAVLVYVYLVKSGILSLLYNGRDSARLQESIKAEAAQMQINGAAIVYAAIVDLFMYGEILLLVPEVKLPAAAITILLILQNMASYV